MMKLLQQTLLPVLAILLAITPVPAAAQETGRSGKNEVVIGVPLPLTGKLKDFGLMMQHSFDMAKEAINAGGGINGQPLRLAYADDQGDPDKAQAVIVGRNGNFGSIQGDIRKTVCSNCACKIGYRITG